MSALTYQNVIETLLQRVPELSRDTDGWHTDLPYDVFGNLGLYVRDLFRKPEQNRELLARIFCLLNEISESGDERLVNLLAVGVLELLADDEGDAALARKFLRSSGRDLLKQLA